MHAVDEDDDWGRVGGHARLVSVILGRSLTMNLELTEWDPPKAFRYTVSQGEGPGNDDNRRTFQPVPGGTRLIGTTEIPTRRGAPGLLDRLQAVLVRAVFARAMSRLPAAAGTLTPVTDSRPDSRHERRATTTAVMVIGLLVAMAAAEHGIGEAMQRPAVNDGPLIKSWPDAAVFDQLNGEPAMTLFPNPVLAGLVTIALSALFAWVALHNGTMQHAGVALLILSGALLPAGGAWRRRRSGYCWG